MNTLPKTNYGESEVILWKRCLEVQSSVRQVAQITFRHRNRRPGKGYLWRSGSGSFHHLFPLKVVQLTQIH